MAFLSLGLILSCCSPIEIVNGYMVLLYRTYEEEMMISFMMVVETGRIEISSAKPLYSALKEVGCVMLRLI